ncbi:MAG TPA: Fe-S cluster assembly protein SufD [Stellaceae bacterium]|nr:Fe-S cluster assembly protein SufD [Stellaceae bacterium]
MTNLVKPGTAPYLAAFRARAVEAEPHWLSEQRDAALARFAALGFPTRREEAWRFTDLRPLESATFLPAEQGAALAPERLAPWRLDGPTHRLVLVAGRFAPELSEIGPLPEGAWLASTARTLAERPDLARHAFDETDTGGGQPFAALNAALFADGFVLALDEGVALDRPVEIIHYGQAAAPASLHTRSAVLLGARSRATLVESFAGEGAYWTNAVAVVRLGPQSELRHLRLQDEGAAAIHFAAIRATLGRAAQYRSFTLTVGARLSRSDAFVRLDGDTAQCSLDGAFLLRGDREATTATFVDHVAPGCVTRELFKGVVGDRAHGVFLGRIAVRPDAQKSDAHQLNRNLLLSPRAAVDTKPELEILADDVKCSHGATVGDLDEAALFYLRARGIPEEEARRMLIEGFVVDALERIEDRAMRDHFARHLGRWLAGEQR